MLTPERLAQIKRFHKAATVYRNPPLTRHGDLALTAWVPELLAAVDQLTADVAELEPFRPQPMSQLCRDGHHNGVGDMRCIGCDCLCHNRDKEVRQLTEDRDRLFEERNRALDVLTHDNRDILLAKLTDAEADRDQAREERNEAKDTLDATMLRFEEYVESNTDLTRERDEALARLAALERTHAEKCEAFTAYVEQHVNQGGCQPVDGHLERLDDTGGGR